MHIYKPICFRTLYIQTSGKRNSRSNFWLRVSKVLFSGLLIAARTTFSYYAGDFNFQKEVKLWRWGSSCLKKYQIFSLFLPQFKCAQFTRACIVKQKKKNRTLLLLLFANIGTTYCKAFTKLFFSRKPFFWGVFLFFGKGNLSIGMCLPQICFIVQFPRISKYGSRSGPQSSELRSVSQPDAATIWWFIRLSNHCVMGIGYA